MKQTPIKRTSVLTRRGILRGRPIRVRGIRPRTPWQSLRADVYDRAGGVCDRCGLSLRSGYEAHHRQLRSGGGPDSLENVVGLCLDCHRWAHANPELARQTGWIVPGWASPGETPILRHGLLWQQPGPSWRVGSPAPWQVEP